MKLWQKIFLCSLALVIFTINLISVLLLSNNHELMVAREEKNAINEHNYIISSVKNTLTYEKLRKNEIFLTDDDFLEIVRVVFATRSAMTSTGASLYYVNQCVVSQQSLSSIQVETDFLNDIDPEAEHQIKIVDDNSNTYMMIVSHVTLDRNNYRLVTSTDITPIYQLHVEQMDQVKIISIVLGIVVAGILLVIVKLLFRPLHKMNEGIHQIAQGHYEKRLKVRGNNEISQLSQNINIMTESIEKNVSALEQVAEDRKKFIGNLAHEMKTPLTSILGFADILRIKRIVREQERQDYASIIVEETKRLRVLSGKLMELITVGTTQLDWRTVSLDHLCEEVALSLKPVMDINQLSLTCQVPPVQMRIDNELFKSLLYNLIDNAVKASSPGKFIAVTAEVNSKEITISIWDNGIGIPAKEKEQILKPFYMLDKSRTRKAGGAGLGLPLCVEIARLHKGTLSIESEVGEGTCVSIHFAEGRYSG